MKVLHLVKTSTGARWAWRQMRELVRHGVEVHVALPPGPGMADDYRAAGVHVHVLQTDLPVRRPWRWPRLFRNLRELVEQVQPDLIHSHFVGTTLSMRLALGKSHPVPRMFQVPGPLHLEHAFFRQAELRTAGPSDYWIGACRWTCNRYRQAGVETERIFLSYYGLDLDQFEHCQPGKLRREINAGADDKLVGMVALMYPPKRYLGQRRGLKGHEDLIDALAIARKRDPKLLGVFIGGGVSAPAYEQRVRERGRRLLGEHARFLGTRGDVPELYPDFDVAVHPSHSENVGGAGESLLLAVPTIGTNVGGLPDVILPGETGWLVRAKSPHKLAEAILEATADPIRARSMAIAGQDLTRRLVDVRLNVLEILGIYETVFGRSARPSEPLLQEVGS